MSQESREGEACEGQRGPKVSCSRECREGKGFELCFCFYKLGKITKGQGKIDQWMSLLGRVEGSGTGEGENEPEREVVREWEGRSGHFGGSVIKQEM